MCVLLNTNWTRGFEDVTEHYIFIKPTYKSAALMLSPSGSTFQTAHSFIQQWYAADGRVTSSSLAGIKWPVCECGRFCVWKETTRQSEVPYSLAHICTALLQLNSVFIWDITVDYTCVKSTFVIWHYIRVNTSLDTVYCCRTLIALQPSQWIRTKYWCILFIKIFVTDNSEKHY
jgi:hypothetical protein